MALNDPITPTIPTFDPSKKQPNNPRGLGFGDFGELDFRRARGEAPQAPAEQANLNTVGNQGNAQVDQYAQKAGLSDQQKNEEKYQVNQSQAILKTSMQETSWLHGLTQLGFDEQTAMTMLTETKKAEAAHRQAYTQLVTTIAKLVVTVYTGGYGAVLFAAGTNQYGTSQGQSVLGGTADSAGYVTNNVPSTLTGQ